MKDKQLETAATTWWISALQRCFSRGAEEEAHVCRKVYLQFWNVCLHEFLSMIHWEDILAGPELQGRWTGKTGCEG